MREKFDRYISRATRTAFLEDLQNSAIFVPTSALHSTVEDCRDPDDNKFLELAVAVDAKAIITGDEDLLALDPWRGIRILRPAAFESIAYC
jgi:putative PIN family toxin of toxin-antitoxin system